MAHEKYVCLNICSDNMHAPLDFIFGFKLIQFCDFVYIVCIIRCLHMMP